MLREDGLSSWTTARPSPRPPPLRHDHDHPALGAGHCGISTAWPRSCGPDLDVHCTSVSEQWAQFLLAWPLVARAPAGVRGGRLCPMRPSPTWAAPRLRCMGVPGRVFRISFSGERAYEVAVPAASAPRSTACSWRQAEAMGGGPLRDGGAQRPADREGLHHPCEMPRPHRRPSTSAWDRMAPQEGLHRLGLVRNGRACWRGREQLVGLRPGGAVPGCSPRGRISWARRPGGLSERAGLVTSAGWSPTLDTSLGLGS
jgi:sarcosine oxidase subunit alpha